MKFFITISICFLLFSLSRSEAVKNDKAGALGILLPIYDCWYYGGNPDSVSPTSVFDPYTDVNLILYNQAFPNGKNIFDIDQKPFIRNHQSEQFLLKLSVKNSTLPRSTFRKLDEHREGMQVLQQTSLDPTIPVKFLIHGFTDNGNGAMAQTIKNAYLENPSKVNVIIVDWGKGSGTSYSEYLYIANYRVPAVALRLAKFIDFLIDKLLFKQENIHLIGHSLGAQICGYTGRNTKNNISVIVGLDPALPAFKNTRTESHLTANDADYVQVIHTASGCLGYDEQIGTADFYPNYNGIIHKMPGCGADPGWHCSHSRAYEYFAESINSGIGFKGWKCDSLNELKEKKCIDYWDYAFMGGEPLDLEAKGVYTLKTGSEAPFARPVSVNDLYTILLKNGISLKNVKIK